jgi:uncharacterized protein
MANANHKAARQYALVRLQSELPPALSYHSLFHTRELVMSTAEALAEIEGLPPDQADVLVTAAAFHDIGYLTQPGDHEHASAAIAGEVLPSFGFSEEQVAQVVGMIMATRLPQRPRNHLEELLADADLAVLGMDIYMERNSALRAEQAATGKTYTDEEWVANQARFLEGHRYFSETARSLFAPGKQKNLEMLNGLLAQNLLDGAGKGGS